MAGACPSLLQQNTFPESGCLSKPLGGTPPGPEAPGQEAQALMVLVTLTMSTLEPPRQRWKAPTDPTQGWATPRWKKWRYKLHPPGKVTYIALYSWHGSSYVGDSFMSIMLDTRTMGSCSPLETSLHLLQSSTPALGVPPDFLFK